MNERLDRDGCSRRRLLLLYAVCTIWWLLMKREKDESAAMDARADSICIPLLGSPITVGVSPACVAISVELRERRWRSDDPERAATTMENNHRLPMINKHYTGPCTSPIVYNYNQTSLPLAHPCHYHYHLSTHYKPPARTLAVVQSGTAPETAHPRFRSAASTPTAIPGARSSRASPAAGAGASPRSSVSTAT